MKNALRRGIGILLTIVGGFALLCAAFAAIGAGISVRESERSFLIFATGGFLISGLLLLRASKWCLGWKWAQFVVDTLPPQGIVLMGHVTRVLTRVKTWHKWVGLIVLLFCAGLLWTNLG